MNAFFDSGVLVKLFATESNSPAADWLAESLPGPFPCTDLQETEVRTAIRLKCARGEISPAERDGALRELDRALAGGKLRRVILDWPAVWRRAEALSAAHAQGTLCRTLDILHVAAALELAADGLVSFDRRQRALAGRAGLNVLPSL